MLALLLSALICWQSWYKMIHNRQRSQRSAEHQVSMSQCWSTWSDTLTTHLQLKHCWCSYSYRCIFAIAVCASNHRRAWGECKGPPCRAGHTSWATVKARQSIHEGKDTLLWAFALHERVQVWELQCPFSNPLETVKQTSWSHGLFSAI